MSGIDRKYFLSGIWMLKERGNARERVAHITNAPRNHLRSIPGTFAEFKDKKLIFSRKKLKIIKITDLPPISLLRHSKGFAASLSFSGEFSRFVELKERGNARERVAHIPNAPRNYLRSIPGVLTTSRRHQCKKTQNFQIFQDSALAGRRLPEAP